MNKRVRTVSVLSGFMGLFLFSSCQGCSGGDNGSQNEKAETEMAGESEIREFDRLEISDTVTAGGRVYDYTLLREPATDLPVVYNEMGGNTRDNTILLTVSCEGGQVFQHKFTKEAFKQQTPEDIYPVAVLQEAGVMPEQKGALPRFWFSLGEPNADLVTFVVSVAADGTFTYQPDVIDYLPEEGE